MRLFDAHAAFQQERRSRSNLLSGAETKLINLYLPYARNINVSLDEEKSFDQTQHNFMQNTLCIRYKEHQDHTILVRNKKKKIMYNLEFENFPQTLLSLSERNWNIEDRMILTRDYNIKTKEVDSQVKGRKMFAEELP